MLFPRHIPLVRLIIPFIAGVVLAVETELSISWSWLMSIPLILGIGIIIVIRFLKIKYSSRWLNGVIVGTGFFLFGFILSSTYSDRNAPNYFLNELNDSSLFVCKILNEPIEKEKSVSLHAEVVSVGKKEKFTATQGKLLIYLEKDTNASLLRYGDFFICKPNISRIAGPLYKGAFDYQKRMFYEDIHFQTYLKSAYWSKLPYSAPNRVIEISISIRKYLYELLMKSGMESNDLAMLSALLFGQRADIDKEIVTAFSNIGVIHILSVSGMHVGLIYGALYLLLAFLAKVKNGNIIRLIIILFLLWLFASITGLSPSVVRATVMFSFVAIGGMFNRYINNYNVLAAAAFLILIINPLTLYNIGFQLSFIAVLGIFLLYKPIYNLFEIKNYILDYMWQMISVSLAAQVLTTPISLYHFHQFPNLFLLSNLIILPLITILMYVGIAALITVPIGLSGLVAKLCSWLVSVINYIALKIDSIPFATTFHIKMGIIETIFLYLAMSAIILYFLNKKKWGLYTFFATILIYLSVNLYDKSHNNSINKVEMIGSKRDALCAIKKGNFGLFLYFGKNEYKAERDIQNYITENRLTKTCFIKADTTFHDVSIHNAAAVVFNGFVETDTIILSVHNEPIQRIRLDDLPSDIIIIKNKVTFKDLNNIKIPLQKKILLLNFVNNHQNQIQMGNYMIKNPNLKIVDFQSFTTFF